MRTPINGALFSCLASKRRPFSCLAQAGAPVDVDPGILVEAEKDLVLLQHPRRMARA